MLGSAASRVLALLGILVILAVALAPAAHADPLPPGESAVESCEGGEDEGVVACVSDEVRATAPAAAEARAVALRHLPPGPPPVPPPER
jgi:hypothetical protein